MRNILLILLLLGGCASHEYSAMPEPTGEWVAANPPEPEPAPVTRVAYRHRWVRK